MTSHGSRSGLCCSAMRRHCSLLAENLTRSAMHASKRKMQLSICWLSLDQAATSPTDSSRLKQDILNRIFLLLACIADRVSRQRAQAPRRAAGESAPMAPHVVHCPNLLLPDVRRIRGSLAVPLWRRPWGMFLQYLSVRLVRGLVPPLVWPRPAETPLWRACPPPIGVCNPFNSDMYLSAT